MGPPSSSGDGPHRTIMLWAPDLAAEQRARAEASRDQVRRELIAHGHADVLIDLGTGHTRALGKVAQRCVGPTVLHLAGKLALSDEAALTILLGRFEDMRCLVLDGDFDPIQADRLGRTMEWIVCVPASLDVLEGAHFAAQLHVALASGQPINLAFYEALDRAKLGPDPGPNGPRLLHRGRPHLNLPPSREQGEDGPEIALSADERARLLELIERSSGIATSVAADLMLERRLGPRLEAIDVGSYTEYLDHIEFHPNGDAELQRAIASITTHETYLFREQYQLDALVETILPELALRRADTRELRLWSAGCSTGEEVYTLAILALESGLFEGWDLKVVGSDISQRVLEIAQAGVYGLSSFRTTPAKIRETYFRPKGRRWAVCDEVRALCSFVQHNLLDTVEEAASEERPDLISCRNVLIYHSDRARAQIMAGFHAQLRPRGYLLLGHSETRIDMGGRFELSSRIRELIYRRR